MDYLQMYPETFAAVKRYAPEDRCFLYEAMAAYAFDGTEPDWPEEDLKWLIWEAMKQRIDVAAMFIEKQRTNGEKGGRPKTQDNPTKPNVTQQNPAKPNSNSIKPNVTQQNPVKPNKSPESESESDTESDIKEKQERERAAEARFARFWEAYPRKTAKLNAKKAFMKLDPDDKLMDAMMAALDRWKKSDQWTRDPTFIPHPATWLNGERWNDQIPDPPKPRERTVAAQQYEQRDYSQEAQDDPPEWMLRRWEEMQREGTA